MLEINDLKKKYNFSTHLAKKFSKYEFSINEILVLIEKSNNDFTKLNFLFNSINSLKDTLRTRGKRTTKDIDNSYIRKFVNYFVDDSQFHTVYTKWKNINCKYARPSLDHKIPLCQGGSNELKNLQFVSMLENIAKHQLAIDDWNKVKINIHNYFV